MQSLTTVLTVTLIVAFAVVYFMIPYLRTLAMKTGFVDMPNARKLHKEPIPLLGGTALYFGFLITVLLMELLFGEVDSKFYGIALGGFLLYAIGVVDDYFKTRGKDFPAWPKFLTHIAAGIVLVLFDVKVTAITIPWMDIPYYSFADHGMGWLGGVVTVIWVVAITNTLNLLDGVDGLAAGIASISGTTLLFISIISGNTDVAVYAVALIGVCLAFLRHNFHPARIFMGDAGATFLGFTLAAIAVDGAFKSAAFVSVLVPILALGVPIFDTIFVIIKRIKARRPIHQADKSHTHHVLMKSGLNQVQTVSFMYLIGICFSLASIVVLLVNYR